MTRASRPALGLLLVVVSVWAAVGFSGCGKGAAVPTSPTPTVPGPVIPTPVPAGPQVFVGAGDIGWGPPCPSAAPEQTARLIESIGGTVFVAGDLAYLNGKAEEFRDCYTPNWGRSSIRDRTRPAPGNHEYVQPNAGPYYQYFGSAAGTAGLGYYSFSLGDWHVVSLNSVLETGGASAQSQWLQQDLAESGAKCTLAYWHYPLFSSGQNAGDGRYMRDIWQILYNAGVEIVVNGHEHFYEQFAPQDPSGRADATRGIRQFIAGTGGASLYGFTSVAANSRVRIPQYGVLKFTLSSGSYQWEFIQVPGAVVDTGSDTCH